MMGAVMMMTVVNIMRIGKLQKWRVVFVRRGMRDEFGLKFFDPSFDPNFKVGVFFLYLL